jgi:hypothetical protein
MVSLFPVGLTTKDLSMFSVSHILEISRSRNDVCEGGKNAEC